MLIMFSHVTNQKHLSVFLRLHPMEAECVCEYDSSNVKAYSLSCPIVDSNLYVFKRFKALKDLSVVTVERGIVSNIFKIQ